MATSFADLKKASANSVEKLQTKLEESSKKGGFKRDERYWRPTKDEQGNALAIIRFLPSPAGEEQPYVTYFDHSFDVNKRYYIERSRTSLGNGEKDPVGEANKALWDTGDEEQRKIASSRKRKLHYVSNILVIKDTNAPENNGKVFLYDYGMKIFGKIKDQAQPELDDDPAVDIFNIFEGKNFKLKIKKQGDFPNYDDSAFLDKSPLAGGDEAEMERIWNQCYSLEAEIAPDKFKSYDELKKKLEWVLYGKDGGGTAEDKVKEQIGGSSRDEDDIDIIDKNINKGSSSKKKEEPKDDEDGFDLDLSDFKLDSDDAPF